jgi:hypothetical protein
LERYTGQQQCCGVILNTCRKHSVAYRDLRIGKAWTQVSIMNDIETLPRSVCTMFCWVGICEERKKRTGRSYRTRYIVFRPLNDVW